MKIYFYCPIAKEPIGAFKEMYKHVLTLKELGYDAYIIHNKKHKEAWFDNPITPIVCPANKLKELIKKNDILVILEVSTWLLKLVECKRIVIFNQAPYHTFYDWGLKENKKHHLRDNRIIAIITVSKNAKEYIEYANFKIPIYRIHYYADNKIFYFIDYSEKYNWISLMTRRNHDDIEQVLQLLYSRSEINYINEYKIKFIEKAPENVTAQLMQKSKFFLHFGYQEGFGIPVLEAMMCGCVVIGYSGFGGEELYDRKFNCKIDTLNVVNFAKKIEEMLKVDVDTPSVIEKMGKKASIFASENYSRLKYKSEIKRIWKRITH